MVSLSNHESLPPDALELAQALMRCPSVTPIDAGALDVMEGALKPLGFDCTRLPFEEPGMVIRPLYDEPFQVAVPLQHPWQERESIPPEDLGNEPVLLLGAGNCLRDQVLQVCPALARGTSASGMQQTVEGSSLETIRYMVASGVGMTILPCTAAAVQREDSAMLRFIPFTQPTPKRRVALAWRKSFTRPQAIEVLINAIKQARSPCVEWVD